MPELEYVLKFALNLLNTPIRLGVYTLTPLGVIVTCLILGCITYVIREFFGQVVFKKWLY